MHQPWKFLIYISADNGLYENAQVSLREITDSSLFSEVEIIAQVDGPTAGMATRYKCEKGSKRLIWVAPENYTADRGDRLRGFLHAAAGNINPNQRILLVLWGEGNGLDHIYFYGDPKDSKTLDNGIANAALDGKNANLYVKDIDLGSILLEFSQKLDRRIDVLGFDACKMAMAEICYEVRESVSIVVGSDEQIPKESWPYEQILRDLARFPGMDASTLSTLIVSRYVEKYKVPGKSDKVSLSAMNLSGSDELAAAVRWMVDAFNGVTEDVLSKRRIFRARDASRTADASYIDLGVFCEELMQSFDENTPVHAGAKEVLFVLKNHSYILYHRHSREDGSFDPYGLAVYFPQVLPPDAAGRHAAAAEFTLATPAALAGMKDPPHGSKDPAGEMKDPPHGSKDPGGEMKDPPHGSKDPGGEMKDPPHGSKDPAGEMKDPPHGSKDPGGEMKDPPHGSKDPGGKMKDPPHGSKDPGGEMKDPPHGSKDPGGEMKDPPHGSKDPGGEMKDPPHGSKDPRRRTSPASEITSYYVLWNSYIPLAFNQATGWADFLARVLAVDSHQKGAAA
jgi:hypothetical protein